MMEGLSKETVINREGKEEQQASFNSVYIYADSGARGSPRPDPPAGGYAA